MSESSGKVLKLLIDTNVWLDYFFGRTRRYRAVTELMSKACGREDVLLCAASLSLKDVAYLVESSLNSQVRGEGRDVTPEIAAAAKETAWGCVRSVMERAYIVPIGYNEALQAFTLKRTHNDFEDDLIIGAAQLIDADYVVTYDELLARRSPVLCLDVEGALAILSRGV